MGDDDEIAEFHGAAPCGLSHQVFGPTPPPTTSQVEKENPSAGRW